MSMFIAVVSADKEIAELCADIEGVSVVGFFDPAPDVHVRGISHLGGDTEWATASARFPGLMLALALDPPAVKERAARYFGLGNLAKVISPHAYVSPSATVGEGCILQRGVSVMADASLGIACKVNLNATVHHDSVVGDYCTLAPGATLLGYVTVGARSFVGAAAVVMPHVTIGEGAVVGAGAVVTKNVAPGSVVAGIPARTRSTHE